MTRAKHGFSAFGLAALVALGLMALGAAGAQAEDLLSPGQSTAGLFLVLHPGKFFIEEGLGEELEKGTYLTFTGEQEKPFRIIVPGRGIIIGCNRLDITEGKLWGEVAHAKFWLLECTVWTLIKGEKLHEYVLGSLLKNCVIQNGIPGEVKFKAILHEKETFVLIEALKEKTLKLVQFQAGIGCVLPLHTEIHGSLGALILQLNSNPQLFTFSPQIQLLLGDKLFYGTFEAYYEGAATLLITGPDPFKDVVWGAH